MDNLRRDWQQYIDDLNPGDWIAVDVGGGVIIEGAYSGYRRVVLGKHSKWYLDIFETNADEPTSIVLVEECLRMGVHKNVR